MPIAQPMRSEVEQAPAPAANLAPRDASLRFEALYEDNFAVAWRLLRALGVTPASIDDAVQDVFLAAYRQLQSFEARSSARTWLCGIVCHVAANYRRRERRKGGLLPLDAALASKARGPLEQLEQSQAWQLVSAFLESLDEGKRVVYALCRIEGQSAPEIAEVLQIPVNTVYSRLHAAEAALQKFLSARGEDTTS